MSHPSSENKAVKQKQEIRLTEQMTRQTDRHSLHPVRSCFQIFESFRVESQRPLVLSSCSLLQLEGGDEFTRVRSDQAAHTVLFLTNIFNSVVALSHRHIERDLSEVLQISLSGEKAPYFKDEFDGHSENVGGSNITRVADRCRSSVSMFGSRTPQFSRWRTKSETKPHLCTFGI